VKNCTQKDLCKQRGGTSLLEYKGLIFYRTRLQSAREDSMVRKRGRGRSAPSIEKRITNWLYKRRVKIDIGGREFTGDGYRYAGHGKKNFWGYGETDTKEVEGGQCGERGIGDLEA